MQINYVIPLHKLPRNDFKIKSKIIPMTDCALCDLAAAYLSRLVSQTLTDNNPP